MSLRAFASSVLIFASTISCQFFSYEKRALNKIQMVSSELFRKIHMASSGHFVYFVNFPLAGISLLPGAPNENIVQNHLHRALLNVFWYLNGRYRHIFIP